MTASACLNLKIHVTKNKTKKTHKESILKAKKTDEHKQSSNPCG